MSPDDEVRHASTRLYAALNRMANGDGGALAEVWSHSASVTAMHPIGGREVGWGAVGASFEAVGRKAANGKIELKDQLIRTAGDMAYELGIEHGHLKLAGHPVTIEHRVTNIYMREAGAWKVVHHHADPSPGMLEALGR